MGNNLLCLPLTSISLSSHSQVIGGHLKKRGERRLKRRTAGGRKFKRKRERWCDERGRRVTRWMSSWEERRKGSMYLFSFFFLNQAQRAFPANFVQQNNARVGRWKRSVLLSGCRLQLALLPSWSAWICTQLSSCLSGRLSLSPREIRPRSDPAYLHTQAQSAHLKKNNNTSTHTWNAHGNT